MQHPYHLVNTALNLANPKDLGWQQRKAASFVFSPLFAGYELRYERSRRHGGYRSMAHYGAGGSDAKPGDGMKLGIPLAISGAAASPNQGYHTSPGLAFLMTVFNVRLGRWCGNTARETHLARARAARSPTFISFANCSPTPTKLRTSSISPTAGISRTSASTSSRGAAAR